MGRPSPSKRRRRESILARWTDKLGHGRSSRLSLRMIRSLTWISSFFPVNVISCLDKNVSRLSVLENSNVST